MKLYYEDEWATIYHGDCQEVLPGISPVDLVLTDPPYGINVVGNKKGTIGSGGKISFKGKRHKTAVIQSTAWGRSDWDKKPPSLELLNQIIQKAKHSILWGGNYFGLPASSKWLVWDKENTGDFADCELAWTNIEGAVRRFKWRWNGMLQEDMSRKEIRQHPTQKPLPLMKWCLGQVKACGSVLDPFAGSGTTLRAAKDLGIKSIGIEIDERYCEIAAERLRQESLIFMPPPRKNRTRTRSIFRSMRNETSHVGSNLGSNFGMVHAARTDRTGARVLWWQD